MELKVNCVPVCSGMCSELDSQKVDNAVKSKRERSLRRVSEILIAISPRGTESQKIVCGYYVRVLCIVCLCIILCGARKDSENLTLILKQSYSLERLCY